MSRISQTFLLVFVSRIYITSESITRISSFVRCFGNENLSVCACEYMWIKLSSRFLFLKRLRLSIKTNRVLPSCGLISRELLYFRYYINASCMFDENAFIFFFDVRGWISYEYHLNLYRVAAVVILKYATFSFTMPCLIEMFARAFWCGGEGGKTHSSYISSWMLSSDFCFKFGHFYV